MDKKEKKFTKIKVNNPDIMNETDESIIKHKITIALCVIAAAILLTVEAYMMINYKNQILFMIFLLIPFSVDVYVVVNSIINISLINRKIEREKYEDLYRAEKASYLILKKNFDKLSQKLFNIEQRAEIPADDLISIQKAVAKAQISRSKENAMALIDSNNKLVQQMGALESKLTNIHSEINENQSELLKKSNDEFLLRNKKLEEKLEDIYAALNNIKGLTESRNLNVVNTTSDNAVSDVDKDSDIEVDDNSNSSVESNIDNGESKNGDELVSSDYQDFNEVKIEENLINDIAFENLKRAEDKEADELSLKEDELSSGEETNEPSQGEEGDELSPQSENSDDLDVEEEPEGKDTATDSENKNEGNKDSVDVKEENSNEKKDKEVIDEQNSNEKKDKEVIDEQNSKEEKDKKVIDEKNSQEEKDKEVIDKKNSQEEKDKEVIGEDNFEKEEKEKPVIPNLDSPDDPNHVLTPEEIEKLFSASNNTGDKGTTNDVENEKANNAGDIVVANNNNDVEASKSIENSVVDETKEKDIVISNSAAENEEKRDDSGLTVENENETSNNAESEKNTTEGTENKIEKNVSVSEEKQNEDQDSQDNKEDDLSSTLGNIDSSDPNKVLSPDEIEKLFANL